MTAAASDPTPFVGKYLDRRDHSVVSFTASGGNLVGWGATLKPVDAGKFEYPGGGTVTFDRTNGTITATAEHDGTVFFTGVRFVPLQLNDTDLATYVGTYKSTELDAIYKLTIETGSLTLRLNWNAPLKLESIAKDEFESSELGTLVFHRNATGRVSGLSLFAGRVRDITFDKTN